MKSQRVYKGHECIRASMRDGHVDSVSEELWLWLAVSLLQYRTGQGRFISGNLIANPYHTLHYQSKPDRCSGRVLKIMSMATDARVLTSTSKSSTMICDYLKVLALRGVID